MDKLSKYEETELRSRLERLYQELFALEEEIADIEARLGEDDVDEVEFIPDEGFFGGRPDEYNPEDEEDDLPF